MPSKEEEEENKQQKSRAKGGQSRPTQPGAKASTAPQRSSDEKTRTSTLPPELENLERSIAQKKRPNAPATTPGAFNATETGREDLSNLEADVMAKQRGRDVALTPQKAKTDGTTSKGASRIGRDLDQLERDVNAKIQRENPAPSKGAEKKVAPTGAGATPMSLDRLEQQVVAKQSSSPLNELEKRVASKNATPESVTPRGLHEAEAAVSKKDSAGGETPMMESSLPGQKGGVGLGLNESQQKFDEDLEYGEYGGPDEQGLAVAFEIEETDDVYIPSAVEFDPDAKPPMVKNRRFRLYFILTVVVVVVGSIGAAIGMTISARKTKQGIPYRETIGIRESAERLVGTAVLEDPSSPYSKALDWITYEDPKQMIPGDSRFKQRYSIAVFYFATSAKSEWSGGCAPAKKEEERETSHCTYSQPREGVGASGMISFDSKRWFSNSDECGWYGLRCDEFGQIRTMRFKYTNMTGSIPEVLSMFAYVQTIQFKFQSLEGTIPESVFELEHLVNVDFSYNKLTGTIPESAYTKSMQRILLAGNSLTGSISSAIAKLNDLKTFTIFRNKMLGSIPTEIGRLQNLQFLRMGRNEFTGTIPTEIGNLRSLYDISAQRMHLIGSLPTEIARVTKLSDMRISYNNITGTIPDELYNMTNLQRLDFQGNMMEGTISSRIGQLDLVNVQLFGNEFTGTIPSEIALLQTLNVLELKDNRFTGSVPEGLCPQQRAAMDLEDVGKISAECGIDKSTGVAMHTCTCCNECCTDEGKTCSEPNPTSSTYYKVDEDEHTVETFQ